jgi:hypothetical protein
MVHPWYIAPTPEANASVGSGATRFAVYQELRVPGSPTIREDGEDLFPVPDRAGYALGCRMYATPEGLKGTPTATMLLASLAQRNLAPGVS